MPDKSPPIHKPEVEPHDHAPVDDAAALGAFQFHKSKLTEWIGNASVATVATRESTYATTRV